MRYRDDVRHRDEEPRARLWHRAAGQRGYFTAAQALEDGYSYPLQHFHTQRGNWLRIDHGLYRFGEYADLPAEDHDHLIRWALWSSGRAVVSHATALGVHELGIANPAEIHLTVPQGFRKRDAAGFRVTTPVRAIAESAMDGLQQDAIDSAVADLLDRGGATRAQLLRAAQQAGKAAELAVERALHAERA
jgi:predicted transcriptional regulator of viral defense system